MPISCGCKTRIKSSPLHQMWQYPLQLKIYIFLPVHTQHLQGLKFRTATLISSDMWFCLNQLQKINFHVIFKYCANIFLTIVNNNCMYVSMSLGKNPKDCTFDYQFLYLVNIYFLNVCFYWKQFVTLCFENWYSVKTIIDIITNQEQPVVIAISSK